MKIITQVARVLVGLLFIFSGVIKANDPIGFSYKLDEYFSVFGEHIWGPLAGFESISIFLAIFITGLEILQGLMLLSGSRIKWNSWALLALIIFFTFLTFYSAYTGYIKECGCFGDVIPLKAWGSFYKDLILLVLIVIILIGKKYIHPIIRKPKWDNLLVAVFTVVSFAFPLYTYAYLPIHMDYKSGEFAKGHNIVAQRKAYFDEQAEKIKKMRFIYKNTETGKEVRLSTQELTDVSTKDTTFWSKHEYVDKEKLDSVDTRLLPLSVAIDFVDKDNASHTDEILGQKGYHFILIFTHLDKASTKAMAKINDFAQLAEQNKIPFIGLTNSEWTVIEDFRHTHQNAFDYYRCTDDTPLKGAIRSNPGLILFKDGVVIEKWHYNAFPSFSDVKAKYIK